MLAMNKPRQALPRNPQEVASLTGCPGVGAEATRIGFKDVVHFTTLRGAVGVLASRAVKSRSSLPKDRYLEHVYRPNADTRKDPLWLDYVNLSIERINDSMFGASARWHIADNNPWVVLAFDVEILGHPGVVFTTTNNIYPSCQRAEGLHGFTAMFADSVQGRYGVVQTRDVKGPQWPTDRQAEVLYPRKLSCEYLRRIDVQLPETVDEIHGALAGLSQSVPVRHAPEVFQ